jgi:hypothetical protein
VQAPAPPAATFSLWQPISAPSGCLLDTIIQLYTYVDKAPTHSLPPPTSRALTAAPPGFPLPSRFFCRSQHPM